MDMLLIPQPDTIPVGWGWFQFLLLLTFPLHLLAMNAMLGGLVISVFQHIRGGEQRRKLAHRIAVVLPLVVAFVVNFGVAPLLFVQVLYGQFIYTSSILMGAFWIAVIPLLIVAYYIAYIYDFQFKPLGVAGPWLALIGLAIVLLIAFFFSNNMLLMSLPERFSEYFSHRDGTMLVTDDVSLWPRYIHMMLGSVAVGSLFVVLLSKFGAKETPELAQHGFKVGMRCFMLFTGLNIFAGFWYLLSLRKEEMMIFLGGHSGATLTFVLGLVLVVVVLLAMLKEKFWATFISTIVLVVVMTFLRAWLRSAYLREFFTLDSLEVVPQYSPMLFFFVTLLVGLVCIGWLLKKTAETLLNEQWEAE